MTDRLLDAKEVAERLNVPETWVRAETRAGRIPHFPLGKYRRYDWPEVVAWLETQQAGQWRKHKPQRPGAGGEVSPTPTANPAQGVVSVLSPTPSRGGQHG
jgi:excisionase family DNA binding protein